MLISRMRMIKLIGRRNRNDLIENGTVSMKVTMTSIILLLACQTLIQRKKKKKLKNERKIECQQDNDK